MQVLTAGCGLVIVAGLVIAGLLVIKVLLLWSEGGGGRADHVSCVRLRTTVFSRSFAEVNVFTALERCTAPSTPSPHLESHRDREQGSISGCRCSCNSLLAKQGPMRNSEKTVTDLEAVEHLKNPYPFHTHLQNAGVATDIKPQ